MFTRGSIQSPLSFKEKFFSLDFILIFSVLTLGIVSMFAMYSTAGGAYDYHTKSHIVRFGIFFGMFIFISFLNIRLWHQTSVVIYVIF